MSRIAARFALFVAICACQPVFAVPIQVVVQGNLIKDQYIPSFWGIVDATVPFQISFVVDDQDALSLAPGTPVITQTGAGYNSELQLINAASVSEFVATIGNMSFSRDNLINRGLGNSPYTFDILLSGALSQNGISGVALMLHDINVGPNGEFISGGSLLLDVLGPCGASFCSLWPTGLGVAEDYLGGVADLMGVQAHTQVITPPDPTSVPEPTTLALMMAGLASMGLIRRRRIGER